MSFGPSSRRSSPMRPAIQSSRSSEKSRSSTGTAPQAWQPPMQTSNRVAALSSMNTTRGRPTHVPRGLIEPAKILGTVGRCQRTGVYFLIQANIRKLDLFDGRPAFPDQLSLQWKCCLGVQPDAVPESVHVMWPNSQEYSLASGDALLANDRYVVLAAKLDIAGWQRREQRTLIVPFLYQDRLPVREDALHFIAIANDLHAITFLEDDFFADHSVRHDVHDRERFDLAVAYSIDRARVIGRLQSACHFAEPVIRRNILRLRARYARKQAENAGSRA